MSTSSSASFNGCIALRTSREPASVWRLCSASFTVTGDVSGRKHKSTRARHFTLRLEAMMIEGAIEILLVEDNPDDVRLTLDTLRTLNITNPVGVVGDGAEALDFLLRTGPYAGREHHNLRLILLDLKLPKVDGHDVLRRIKANPDTQMIPVVVFTSSRQERDIVESYRLGTNSYVVKPIDYDQ